MSSFIREFWIARARRLEALQGLFRSIPLHAMQSWARTGDVVLERVVPCMLHLALELAKTCIKAGRAVANQRKADGFQVATKLPSSRKSPLSQRNYERADSNPGTGLQSLHTGWKILEVTCARYV